MELKKGDAEWQMADQGRRTSDKDNEILLVELASLQRLFEELRARTESHVRARVAKRTDVDPGEKERIVGAVYQQIWKAIYGFDPARTRKPVSWFMTVVDHAIVDHFRRTKKTRTQPTTEEIVDDRTRDSGLASERRLGFALLCQALAQLEPSWRDILLLTAMYPDMTYEEIAEATGEPNVQAARQLKYRAIMGIRKVLKKMGVGHGILGLLYR